VNACLDEGHPLNLVPSWHQVRASALSQSVADSRFLTEDQLADTPLGAHTDLSRVDLQLTILGLLCVRTHGIGDIPNSFGFVNGLRVRQRSACCVIPCECDCRLDSA